MESTHMKLPSLMEQTLVVCGMRGMTTGPAERPAYGQVLVSSVLLPSQGPLVILA